MFMHAIVHVDCAHTVRESALKADAERKISCRTGESNQPQRRARVTSYPPSYIPTPLGWDLDLDIVARGQQYLQRCVIADGKGSSQFSSVPRLLGSSPAFCPKPLPIFPCVGCG